MYPILQKITLGLVFSFLTLLPQMEAKTTVAPKESSKSNHTSSKAIQKQENNHALRITTTAIDGTFITITGIVFLYYFFFRTYREKTSWVRRLGLSIATSAPLFLLGNLIVGIVSKILCLIYKRKYPKNKDYFCKKTFWTSRIDVLTLLFSFFIGACATPKSMESQLNRFESFFINTEDKAMRFLSTFLVVYGLLSLGTISFRQLYYWEFFSRIGSKKADGGKSKKQKK